MKIELENGKYTYIFNEGTGEQEVFLYEIISGVGHVVSSSIDDNFILAMAHEIQRLRQRLGYKED